MAQINIKVKSDFAQASKDLKQFAQLSEKEGKKIEKFQKNFKDDQIKAFNDRMNRSTIAIKATRGEAEALTNRHKMLQRQIETLIRRGLDPAGDEIKTLTDEYRRLESQMDDIDRASKKQQKSMDITKGLMIGLGASAILMGKQAVGAFIEFSKESAQAASDAEETGGKFGVVFGNITGESEKAAKEIAADFKLADSTVKGLLGDTGDILTGLGFDQETALRLSKQVATLGLDLASFTNFAGGAEGASQALTKALLGEAEQAKALGIVIRQDTKEYKDLIKSTMEAEGVGLTQAKALVALKIATEQSKNAIGDFARTQDSTANVNKTYEETLKSLKEEYGILINEGLTPFRRVQIKILTDIRENIKEQRILNEVNKDYKDGLLENTGGLEDLKEKLKVVNKSLEEARFIEESSLRSMGLTGDRLNEVVELNTKSLGDQSKQLSQLILVAEREQSAKLRGEKQNQINAKAEKARLEKELERTELIIDAEKEIESIRSESLTSLQKEQKEVKKQIAVWSKFKDVTEVAELLNELIEKRTRLEKEALEILTDEEKAEIKLNDKKVALLDSWNEKLEQQTEDKLERLELEKTAALKTANEVGADTTLIHKFYANEKNKIDKKAKDDKDKLDDKAEEDRIKRNEKELLDSLNLANNLLDVFSGLLDGTEKFSLDMAASITGAIASATGSVELQAASLGLSLVDKMIEAIGGPGISERIGDAIARLFEGKGSASGSLADAMAESATGAAQASADAAEAIFTSSRDKITNQILDSERALAQSVFDLSVSNFKAIEDAKLDLFLNTLSAQEVANLKASGVISETNEERINREIAEAKEAGDTELENTLNNELAIAKIRQESLDAQAEAEKVFQAETNRIDREKAVASRDIAIAEAKINKLLSLSEIPQGTPQFSEIEGLYDTLISQISATPIPTFQTGTGVNGFTAPTSTQSDNVPIAVGAGETVTVGARGEEGGRTQNIIVELAEQPIISVINKAIESGDIRITTENIQGGGSVA